MAEEIKIIGDPISSGIGFTCKICDGTQEVPYLSNHTFPVCDICISKLREFVTSKQD